MAPNKKSEKQNEEKEVPKDFETDLQKQGLDETTAAALWENGFDSVESLSLLAGEDDVLKDLPISIAQRLRLKRVVKDMRGSQAADEHACKPQPVPDTGLATAPHNQPTSLTQVLSEIKHDGGHSSAQVNATAGPGAMPHAAPPRADIFGAAAAPQSADPQAYLRGGCDPKTLNVHEIVDYVNLVPPVMEEEVISEHGTSQFVHRSGAKRPKLANVAIEEWCLANTRIMDILVSESPSILRDYMAYTMKVCELFKCYERPSVLQYDREYRYMQARQCFRWGTDAPHLHTLHLRLKSVAPSGASMTQRTANYTSQRSRRTAATTTDGQQQVCYQFNSKDGCSYGSTCRYKHACSEKGCTEHHPRVLHHPSGTGAGR